MKSSKIKHVDNLWTFIWSVSLLNFFTIVFADCDWSVLNVNTVITDLRTATPLDFTLTVSHITNCATAPVSVTGYYTAVVNGTYYTEQNPITLLYSTQTITYATVSFPDLIMTQLAPGEEKQWTQTVNPLLSTATGGFTLTVGQNAVTNPTTSSASSYTTTTSPDPNNVGPIVGGVVGTIAGLVFLALLGWLFVMHRRRQNSHATDPPNYHPTYPNDKGINYSGPTEMFHQPQYQGGESDDHEAMSGRLRYN